MGNNLCGLGRPRKRTNKKQSSERENASSIDQTPSSQTESTQSDVESGFQPSESVPATDLPGYSVCYHHTGENYPSRDWFNDGLDLITYNPGAYESAQEIVEEVGEHYMTHLVIVERLPPSLNDIAPNLTHLGIANLEDHSQLESLGELKKLQVLNLQHNYFSSGLPSVIGELTSLRELHIEEYLLTDLPEGLGELRKLEVLTLLHCDFSSGLPSVIGEMTCLRKLHLEDCSLTNLPSNMSGLKQLTTLVLDVNHFINGCPSVIPQLTSLTKLSLEHCNLTTLPPRLGRLQQLKELNLDINNFSNGLSNVIGELDSLTKLSLNECSLTVLPPMYEIVLCFSLFYHKLTIALLPSNYITHLPDLHFFTQKQVNNNLLS